MLNEIYEEMILTLRDRGNSQTVYAGWGTTIDRLVDEYLSAGGSWCLVRSIERLAEDKR